MVLQGRNGVVTCDDDFLPFGRPRFLDKAAVEEIGEIVKYNVGRTYGIK